MAATLTVQSSGYFPEYNKKKPSIPVIHNVISNKDVLKCENEQVIFQLYIFCFSNFNTVFPKKKPVYYFFQGHLLMTSQGKHENEGSLN